MPPIVPSEQSTITLEQQDNPLVWPLLSVLQDSQQHWKIHCLASELKQHKLLLTLDDDPEQDLFKRNFLLMNALFQLQQILLPQQWLQVQAMDIYISDTVPNDITIELTQDSVLRQYYLDWTNYDISNLVIREMLAQFWHRYEQHIGAQPPPTSSHLERITALKTFELEANASEQDIRRQWRRLALRWHPDRDNGSAEKFRQVCEAWQLLRC